MHRILIMGPGRADPSTGGRLARALRDAGYTVEYAPNAGAGGCLATELCETFDGVPPHAVFVDLVGTTDALALRHLQRVLRQTWGGEAGAYGGPRVSGGGGGISQPGPDNAGAAMPPVIALLGSEHLGQPDWPAWADDFLLPPYAPEEALARLRLALFRRRHLSDGDLLRFCDLTLDLSSGRATGPDGEPLTLTPREWDLLRFLTTHRGKLWSRERLLDLVWGVHYQGGLRTVDIHVRRLRAKLPPGAGARLETRRGVGYGFVV
jgi:hypothetical protein